MSSSLDRLAYAEAEKIHAETSFVSKERMAQHGGIVTEYARLAKIWSAMLGIEMRPEQCVAMMAVHKANRIMCGTYDHRDHYLDGSNYFALAWGTHVALKKEPPDEQDRSSSGNVSTSLPMFLRDS